MVRMNDTARIQNAIKFIDCLANGVNPVTGEILQETVFDEPEVIRCLFFVKDVLQEKTSSPAKSQKDKFVITDDLRLEDFLQTEPVSLSPFLRKIKETNGGAGPNAGKIWGLLIEKGYLREGTNADGKATRLPTDLGRQSGISCVERVRMTGKSYIVVVYNRKAQQLIIDCIKELYSS